MSFNKAAHRHKSLGACFESTRCRAPLLALYAVRDIGSACRTAFLPPRAKPALVRLPVTSDPWSVPVIKLRYLNLKPVPTPTPKPFSLTDYTEGDDVQARMTIDGRIVALEKHFSVTMTVAKLHRDLNVFNAYSATPSDSVALDNNQPAFEDFIRALHNAGFESSTKNPRASDTYIGLCPFGQRYIFEFFQGGNTLMSSWATTCSDPTNFTGNAATIRALFQAQFIPQYQTVVGSIEL